VLVAEGLHCVKLSDINFCLFLFRSHERNRDRTYEDLLTSQGCGGQDEDFYEVTN